MPKGIPGRSTCTIDGCSKNISSRGLCSAHTHRLKRYGDPLGRPARFRDTCTIQGCSEKHYGRGWCNKHYMRWWVHGDPHVVQPHPLADPVKRFWERIDQRGDCWLWTGLTSWTGYGLLSQDGRHVAAHRFAYALLVGPIPPGMFICHKCDVPRCVRPDHLFLGTAGDNARDMSSKGRHGRKPGTPAAKLNEQSVIDIRRRAASGETRQALAKEYNVSLNTVARVVNRITWRHVA